MRNIDSDTKASVAAIIVLYCPNLSLLHRLLVSINNQVEKIFVVDNTPGVDCISSTWFVEQEFDVTYIPLHDNYGIATAQNRGITAAMQSGCDHVILFDQDSCPSAGMVQHLLQAERQLLENTIKVGSVGPVFIDEKTGEYSKGIRHGLFFLKKIDIFPTETLPVPVDRIIASGSLIRTSVLSEIGLMKEELFIDWVDIEWCLRAKSFNYLHFMIPPAKMQHSIGDEYVSIGEKKVNLHSDIRNYYIVRNACHLVLDKKMDKRWRFLTLFKIPQYIIFYSMTSMSKQRFKTLKTLILLLRACAHGCSGRLGKAF